MFLALLFVALCGIYLIAKLVDKILDKRAKAKVQGVQDQNFRIQMLISLSIFDLGEKFQVLRRFEKYTFFSSQ